MLDYTDIEDLEDLDEPPPQQKLPITGFCEQCGKAIVGKPRRYCDVECLWDYKELNSPDYS